MRGNVTSGVAARWIGSNLCTAGVRVRTGRRAQATCTVRAGRSLSARRFPVGKAVHCLTLPWLLICFCGSLSAYPPPSANDGVLLFRCARCDVGYCDAGQHNLGSTPVRPAYDKQCSSFHVAVAFGKQDRRC
jgi:hypothetical protein